MNMARGGNRGPLDSSSSGTDGEEPYLPFESNGIKEFAGNAM
jgi:hypothetical protein